MKGKYQIYASVYKIPELALVKAHMIVVVDEKGNAVETVPGPVNIGPLVGRFTQGFAKDVVKEFVASTFDIDVEQDAIELMPYEKVGKMLFKLENK
jgi:hypothetical protein